jgi:uncharacterized membrane protein YdbT with pleckstrin-like domain
MQTGTSAATGTEQVLFEGHPATVQSLGELLFVVLSVGLMWLYYYLRARGVRYRVTNQRVIVERGLFGKRLDQIDTYRIHDYVVDRPFLQRIMGTGNVLLMSVDRSTPAVQLRGLKVDVVALYESLRRATEEQKRARGVRVLDADS